LKHDRADARVLGELLRTNFLPESYMPDEETRREKRFLINDRVKYGALIAEPKGSLSDGFSREEEGYRQYQKTPFSTEGKWKLRRLGLQEIDIRLEESSNS
jgi:hypothetical protein